MSQRQISIKRARSSRRISFENAHFNNEITENNFHRKLATRFYRGDSFLHGFLFLHYKRKSPKTPVLSPRSHPCARPAARARRQYFRPVIDKVELYYDNLSNRAPMPGLGSSVSKISQWRSSPIDVEVGNALCGPTVGES